MVRAQVKPKRLLSVLPPFLLVHLMLCSTGPGHSEGVLHSAASLGEKLCIPLKFHIQNHVGKYFCADTIWDADASTEKPDFP